MGRYAGLSFSLGIGGVLPNGKGADGQGNITTPTTVTATQNGVTINLPDVSNTANPNNFGGGVPLNGQTKMLTGEWAVTLKNGADSRSITIPGICNSNADADCASKLLPAPVTNVKISFASGTTTPTFSWDLGDPVDRVAVSYYDLDKRDPYGAADKIVSTGLPGDTETFTIPEEWGLKEDGHYAFRIDTRKVRNEQDGTATITPSGFSTAGAALAETITFYDFAATLSAVSPELYLPVDRSTNPDGNPVFDFDNPVLAQQVSYYDPILAVGYDYLTGAGDPLFYSFILPEIGDNLFDLYLWDGTDYVFETTVAALEEYIFSGLGVDRFRILGIETSAGLDPNDATAFATGLSFVSDGRFTGSMTPITLFVDDPVTVPLAMLGFGLAGLGLIGRRQAKD